MISHHVQVLAIQTHGQSCEFRFFFRALSRIPTLIVECNFNRVPTVIPDALDFRSGIFGALQKLYGSIGAGKFVWKLNVGESTLHDGTKYRFKVTLEDPVDSLSRQRFCAGVSATRVVGTERVVFRIVEQT